MTDQVEQYANRAAQITSNHNVNASSARPTLSILVPYFRDDPALLLSDLLVQAQSANETEILFYDDGTNDASINTRLENIAQKSTAPIRLFFAAQNKGRSFARNYLKSKAQADWVLFLDADMRPEEKNFLNEYLSHISEDTADIIFGGFTVPKIKQSEATELHRAFSQTSDCLNAEQRRKNGAQYVCSSNLCVRKTVLDAEPFDPEFKGWGWEDSEWAARVTNRFRLAHADIPALHLGLESTDTLLSRFKNSGANYKRFTSAHPDLAKTLTLYKMATRLHTIPGQKLMRPLLKSLVRSTALPTKFRLVALKLWRASWYAEVLT